MLSDCLLLETMPDEIGLAKPSRRNKRNVVVVGQQLHNVCRFLLAVAEIGWSCIPFRHKWILHLYHTIIVSLPQKYLIPIKQPNILSNL